MAAAWPPLRRRKLSRLRRTQRQRFAVDTHRAHPAAAAPTRRPRSSGRRERVPCCQPSLSAAAINDLQRRIARPRPPSRPGWRQCDRTLSSTRDDRGLRHPEAQITDGHASRWRSPASAPPSGRGSGRGMSFMFIAPPGIHHIDTGRAMRFHLQRPAAPAPAGRSVWLITSRTDGVHPQLAGKGNMLRRDASASLQWVVTFAPPKAPRPDTLLSDRAAVPMPGSSKVAILSPWLTSDPLPLQSRRMSLWAPGHS